MGQIKRILGVSCIACCLVGFIVTDVSAVSLSNGEYVVVVAIDPTMPHAGNENLINDIEDMMRDASSYLHTAQTVEEHPQTLMRRKPSRQKKSS